MRQTLRHNVFETNSSSIHDLAIAEQNLFPDEYEARYFEMEGDEVLKANGEFGWGLTFITDVAEKINYLFVIAMDMKKYYNDDHYLEKLKKCFPRVFFKEYAQDEDIEGYVDHSNSKTEILRWALNNIDEYLNKGILILENDNDEYDKKINKELKKYRATIVESGGN